ncbi:MAG: YebC/PmpR family DNA-binding transcriptional regulator [Candidatus Dojkabacteria bacterium]|nr:YebC/PmpR family DNA-binding transcriptional regulator [Candidatus Dojkabacteria bacterium]
MSGHSKWKKIKRQKGAADQKKGNLFTKLGQAITLAVREGGGGEEDTNFMLRMAVSKAKEENVPKDTIKRAINRGLGKSDDGAVLEQVTYEIVGASGVAILIDCTTDNKNRTVSDIRKVLSKSDFNMGGGSLAWQFDSKGIIFIDLDDERRSDAEDIMLDIMEISGVEDVQVQEGKVINILTKRESFKEVYQRLREKNYEIADAFMGKKPKNLLTVDQSLRLKVDALRENLLELEDVDYVWTNINLQ